jgi:hypothetical protein
MEKKDKSAVLDIMLMGNCSSNPKEKKVFLIKNSEV